MSAARKVKLFVNKLNLNFSEIEDLEATQELALDEKDVDSKSGPIALWAAKFSKVSSLSIFIANNQGDEEKTKISRIVLFGVPHSNSLPSNVKVIESPLEYDNLVKNNPGKTVIAYFNNPMCTHCLSVGPLVHKVSLEHPEIVIMSINVMTIDVNNLKVPLHEVEEIHGVPHFIVYKDGIKVAEHAGVPHFLADLV